MNVNGIAVQQKYLLVPWKNPSKPKVSNTRSDIYDYLRASSTKVCTVLLQQDKKSLPSLIVVVTQMTCRSCGGEHSTSAWTLFVEC